MKGKVPDRIMRDIFRRRKAGGGAACADEGTVAAYLEGALTTAERKSFEQHASVCPDCQELVGLSIRMSEDAPLPEAQGAEMAPSRGKVLFRLSIPVVGLAVAGLFVVAGVLVLRHAYRTGRDSTTQVADVRLLSQDAKKPAESSEESPRISPQSGRPPEEKAERTDEAPVPAASVASVSRAKTLDAAAPGKPAAAAKQVGAEPDAALVAQNQSAVRPAVPPLPVLNEPAEERGTRQAAPPAAAAVGVVGGVAGAPSRSEARFDQVRLGKESSARAGGEVQRFRTTLSAAPAQEKGQASGPAQDPRQVLLNFAAEAKAGAKDEAATQAIGDRIFHARGSYWVDQKCANLQDVEIVGVARDSSEFQSIVDRYPGLPRLFDSGKSVLLSWEGKVYLVR